jgi:hypothetical protein
LYRRRERKKAENNKASTEDVRLLGYNWKNVSSWKFDSVNKICILYNDNRDVLDNLYF